MLLLEKFREADNIEKAMREIYTQCAELAEDEKARKTLLRMASQEDRHDRIEESIIKILEHIQ